MAVKKSIFICIFVGLTLALPGLLFLADEAGFSTAVNLVEGDGSCADEHLPVWEESPVNFSSLVCSPDKDEAVAEKKELWLELARERAEAEAQAEAIAKAEAAKAAEQSSAGSSASAGTREKEQQMLTLINRARNDAGLPSLTLCSELSSVARAKSRDMVDNNYFSHTSPRYGGLGGLLSHFGISYRTAGENLAMNSSGSVSAAHSSLMGSPGHRANIMGSNFSRVGIGIQVKSNGNHYYTQLFVGS